MKRFFAWVLVLSLVLLPAGAAAADSYDVGELGMRFSIPEGHVVFTRNIDGNDPNLAKYGMTKEGLYTAMERENIYLSAWDPDRSYEIMVTSTPIELNNFNTIEDSVLLTMMDQTASTIEERGESYIGSEIYQHPQTKFLRVSMGKPEDPKSLYRLQYYTIYGHKAINITMISQGHVINTDWEGILQEVVDRMEIVGAPQVQKVVEETPEFSYLDEQTGVSFVVPRNWSPAHEPETDRYEAKFVLNSDSGVYIVYTGRDAIANMPDEKKRELLRPQVGQSVLSEAQIAEIAGVDAANVSTVSINGVEYYRISTIIQATVTEMDVQIPSTLMLHIKDGWGYCFAFTGDENSRYYSDFESLLGSVHYPEKSSMPMGVLMVLLWPTIAALALTIAVLFYRFAIEKAPLGRKKAQQPYPDFAGAQPESTARCHKCGAPLREGSRFCIQCGASTAQKGEGEQ